jgi:hypothetical protein
MFGAREERVKLEIMKKLIFLWSHKLQRGK